MSDGDVIDINARRRKPPTSTDDTDHAECADCGSWWFALTATQPANATNGAVTLDGIGMVTGYAGMPHCIECGREWAPRGGWKVFH